MNTWPDIRLTSLDGLRGIAVLLVMVHHATFYGGMQLGSTVDRWYYRIAYAGWSGVDLFFVLSGFLITGILSDSKGGEHFFRNFYARRVLRIFPLYYGFLFVLFILAPLIISLGEGFRTLVAAQLWYWGYLQNILKAREGWPPLPAIAHFWSLAVEEQFYLVWPAIVYLTGRRGLIVVCLTLLAGAVTLRMVLSVSGHSTAAYVLTPARIDGLALGALLAVAARGSEGLSSLTRWSWPAASGAALAVAATFAWRRGWHPEDPLVQILGYSMLALLFGSVLVIAVASSTSSRIGRIFTHSSLVLLGRYSYALYVVHAPIVLLARRFGLSVSLLPEVGGSQLPGQLLFMVTTGGLALGVAVASWHAYESRFLKLKGLFPYKPRG